MNLLQMLGTMFVAYFMILMMLSFLNVYHYHTFDLVIMLSVLDYQEQ
jgi:hypothetical protein